MWRVVIRVCFCVLYCSWRLILMCFVNVKDNKIIFKEELIWVVYLVNRLVGRILVLFSVRMRLLNSMVV